MISLDSLSIDRSKRSTIESASACPNASLSMSRKGLHLWLVLKVRPALVRNGEHIRPRRAAVHQFVESIVDRPLGLDRGLVNTFNAGAKIRAFPITHLTSGDLGELRRRLVSTLVTHLGQELVVAGRDRVYIVPENLLELPEICFIGDDRPVVVRPGWLKWPTGKVPVFSPLSVTHTSKGSGSFCCLCHATFCLRPASYGGTFAAFTV